MARAAGASTGGAAAGCNSIGVAPSQHVCWLVLTLALRCVPCCSPCMLGCAVCGAATPAAAAAACMATGEVSDSWRGSPPERPDRSPEGLRVSWLAADELPEAPGRTDESGGFLEAAAWRPLRRVVCLLAPAPFTSLSLLSW